MSYGPTDEVVLFTEALGIPFVEREAFLQRACGPDSQLRERLTRLLELHDDAGTFLEQGAADAGLGRRLAALAGKKVGDRIGRYKLLQKIGEGGCGVVFMAEQEEPVRRRVALKVIKPGMDTNSVIARFEAERQALAMMDHPNIAKVFDAGATESGHPFFVMELIKGMKITEYCDRHSLTGEQRMELFVQVCQAVQHAHQKGIIHRDIKPSNILVTTTEDGAASPMVIDFGIAKATTSQRLTDKTVFTAFEMLIGTPAYMSPEQAEPSAVDLDTRTDIYSLGVLLYELLTGSTPFDGLVAMKGGVDEIRRVIREREPAPPSTRLSGMTELDLGAAARCRRSAPPALIRSVRGDLDWIVMKALEKDRRRRYETANGLALDIQRHLANEPISARPPSKLYRFQKTVARNKILFGAMLVIASLLVASLALVTASLGRERLARREAQTAATRSEQVTQFLKDMLQGVGPSVAAGEDTAMLRGILDKTAERISSGMASQPEVQADLGGLIGRLYQEIGNYDGAEAMHRKALALHRRLHGSNSLEVAAALDGLGQALWKKRTLPEAAVAHEEALAIRKALLGSTNAEVATSLSHLSDAYRRLKRVEEAKTLTREALEIRRKLCGNESLEVADSLRSLSILLGDDHKRAESEATAREVLAMRRRILSGDDALVAASLVDLAWAAGYTGKSKEAETLEREALAMRRRLLGEEHPDVARTLYLIGDRIRGQGRLQESESLLNAALGLQRKRLGIHSEDTLDSLRSLGFTLEAAGRLSESEAVHREALELKTRRYGSGSPQALAQVESIVVLLLEQRKFKEADQLLYDSLPPGGVAEPARANILALRAELNGRRGQWSAAVADASRVLEQQPDRVDRYHTLAALLAITHDTNGYARLCRNFLARFANTTDPHTADCAAKDSLMFENRELDSKLTSSLAERAVTLGKDDAGMPFYQVCKALSEYRLGHFSSAADWAERSAHTGPVYARAHACAVLAMARCKLGRTADATISLEEGNSLAPARFPAEEARENGVWMAWAFARVSLEEAKALLSPTDSTPSPAVDK